MNLVTASFSELAKVVAAGYYPISIAARMPANIKQPVGTCHFFYPTWEMIKAYKRDGDIDSYTKKYCSQILVKVAPATAVTDMIRQAQNAGYDKVAMLCWEKPGDFCHRRLAAEFLESALGIDIPEFSKREQVKLF